ncbi:tagaturonate reductase [Vibrio sp. 2-Bac 85]
MMETLNRSTHMLPNYPTKIIQFGEGNFLRAFVDWQVDLLNEFAGFNAGITIIRPIKAEHPKLDNQDGLYTALIQGINEEGSVVSEPRIVSSINKEIKVYGEYDAFLLEAENEALEWIISNTTEAGICFDDNDLFSLHPANTFPGKLIQFLHHRYNFFSGDLNKGLIFLPCELIDYNGEKLKETLLQYCELWSLEEAFVTWLEKANTFCSTLVDRIVTGYPSSNIQEIESKLGYKDNFLVSAEYFYLFVIQGPDFLNKKLCLDKYPLNIKIVEDIKPYKERKVGILNGVHTALVPVAYLAGVNTVAEAMNDKQISIFINRLLHDEIIPSLDIDKKDLISFSHEVINRFKNPYIEHFLTSISLNSFAKFNSRILPQMLNYLEKNKQAPKLLSFSLASLICFYLGKRGSEDIPLNDDEWIMKLFSEWRILYENDNQQLVNNVLGLEKLWGRDLNQEANLTKEVVHLLTNIKNIGIRETLKKEFLIN